MASEAEQLHVLFFLIFIIPNPGTSLGAGLSLSRLRAAIA